MLFLGIKETTREYRLKKWADIIAEQRKSGLSIKAFFTDRDLANMHSSTGFVSCGQKSAKKNLLSRP